jgi:hypothetical protein
VVEDLLEPLRRPAVHQLALLGRGVAIPTRNPGALGRVELAWLLGLGRIRGLGRPFVTLRHGGMMLALAPFAHRRDHGAMTGDAKTRRVGRLIAAAALALGLVGGPLAVPGTSASLPRWTGGIDLYRAGTFSTQQSWLWCTAADLQIIRNIVDGARDHSPIAQERYFAYMRAHNRYAIPVSDGVDPAGWAAGLRHYVDARYRLVVSGTFSAALRSAVTNLRRTNRPVGLLVAHGDHAWVLTGFTATADPARTSRFTVTSVRITGPLYGLQSRTFGYDMPPDTRLTPAQLAHFMTRWHYAGIRMAWEGRWVTIAAVASASGGSPPAATSRPAASSMPKPSHAPKPMPAPGASPSSAPATAAPTAEPAASAAAVAAVETDRHEPGGPALSLTMDAGDQIGPGLALGLIVLAAVGSLVVRRRRSLETRRKDSQT